MNSPRIIVTIIAVFMAVIGGLQPVTAEPVSPDLSTPTSEETPVNEPIEETTTAAPPSPSPTNTDSEPAEDTQEPSEDVSTEQPNTPWSDSDWQNVPLIRPSDVSVPRQAPNSLEDPTLGVPEIPTVSSRAARTSSLVFIGTASTTGVQLTIDGRALQSGVSQVQIAHTEQAPCQGTACASASSGGTKVEATTPRNLGPNTRPVSTLSTTDSTAVSLLTNPTAQAATATVQTTPTADAEANGFSTSVVLTPALEAEVSAYTANFDAQSQALATLFTAVSTSGYPAQVTAQLNQLRGDHDAAPLIEVYQQTSKSTSTLTNSIVTATSTVEPTTVVIGPTPDSTDVAPAGLAFIQLSKATVTASANGRSAAQLTVQNSDATIVLLPGILTGLPALAGKDLATVSVTEALGALPAGIAALLPGNGAAGSGVEVSAEHAGFVVKLDTDNENACFLAQTPFTTCVTRGTTATQFSTDRQGASGRVGGVAVESLYSGANGSLRFNFSRANAGANARVVTTTTNTNTGRTTTGSSSGSRTPTRTSTPSRSNLPRTGPEQPALPALILMVLSGGVIVALRRQG